MIDNIKDLDELFEYWKNIWKERKDTNKYDISKYVRDGIVNRDAWEEENRKILIILKEPNDEQGEKTLYNDYDLCNTLHKDNKIKKEYATWRNIFLWAYGLLNTTREKTIEFEEAKKRLDDGNFDNIAILNLKKSYGTATSNMKDIEEFVQKDKELILKEIELINPDIIITANIMYLVEMILPKEQLNKTPKLYDFEHKDWINEWKNENKSVCIIKHYHPQATSCKEIEGLSDEIKYRICCECFRQYLQVI
ncbi:hypothetical protein IZY60_10615 [Lutibacter sp. B2]|nr:hypothetical protein [Lutibacter sp. B2]